jgi:Tol biopolymer transport system component
MSIRSFPLAALVVSLLAASASPGVASASSRIVFAAEGKLLGLSPQGGRLHLIARIPRSTIEIAASTDGRRFALVANRALPHPKRGSVRSFYVLDVRHGLRLIGRLHIRAHLSIAFSPDGRRIAFCRGGEIWQMRTDGGGVRRLTDGPGLAFDPAFLPSGRGLVFVRHEQRGGTRIVRAGAFGSAEVRLAGADARAPAVSSRGDVAFDRDVEGPGAERILVMRGDGSGRRTIVKSREPVFDTDPTFSPAGRRVAFMRLWEPNGSATSYRYSIHTVSAAGGRTHKVIGGLRSTADEPLRKGRGPAGPLWVPLP